jgi:hypothetical protein
MPLGESAPNNSADRRRDLLDLRSHKETKVQPLRNTAHPKLRAGYGGHSDILENDNERSYIRGTVKLSRHREWPLAPHPSSR